MNTVRTFRYFTLVAATLLACGGDSSGPSSTYAGAWAGTTSQNTDIRFLVEGNGITVFTTRWTVVGSCTRISEPILIRLPPNPAFPIANDEFSVASNNTDTGTNVEGVFDSPTQASGTMQVSSATCNGNDFITWTATKATGPTVNLNGNWEGVTASNVLPSTPFTATLTVTGDQVSGTYGNANGAAGTASGTIVDRILKLRLIQEVEFCRGTFNGLGVARRLPAGGGLPERESLLFLFTGRDCLGDHLGTGSATQQ